MKDQGGLTEDDPAAIMFVKRTAEGALIKKLCECEEAVRQMAGHRLKLVERAGRSLKNLLWCADP